MTNDDLKNAVAEKFAQKGIWINRHQSLKNLVTKVEEHTGIRRTGRETQFDYLRKFAGIQREYSPAKWIPPFRPMKAKPHLRQAEIDQHPGHLSMPWDGRMVTW